MCEKSIITKGVCVVLLATLLPFSGLSQEPTVQLPEKPIVIPPSPSVSTFQEFSSIPVSHFTGSLNYSIVLAEVNSDIASFPVTLSYKSNGIKVNDVSSVCGLGWDLSAGGVISRVINGKPDELPTQGAWNFLSSKGFSHIYSGPDAWISFTNHLIYNVNQWGWYGRDFWSHYLLKGIEPATGPSYDFELDLFSYSFGGYSGTFYVTWNHKVYPLVDDGLKFICLFNESGRIYGFKAIDLEGREYYFGNSLGSIETITSISIPSGGDLGYDAISDYNSAWHLSKIKKHGYDKEILFEYLSNVEKSIRLSDSKQISTYCSAPSITTNDTRINYNSKKIHRISWEGGVIVFDYELNNRMDMYDKLGARLKSVQIKDNYDREIKKVVLNNNFYISNNTVGVINNSFNFEFNKYRLFLDGINIVGYDNLDTLKYSFSYHMPLQMPYQNSTALDFWGYYNGKNNSTLIPTVHFPICSSQGADRTIGELEDIKKGILTKITYPSKGYSLFNYENNNYYSFVSEQNEIAGGLRISSIEFRDYDHSFVTKKKYSYNLDNNISSGQTPMHEGYRRFYYNNFVYSTTDCQLNPVITILPNPVLGYEFVNGNSVGYTCVSITNWDSNNNIIEGKEVYHYNGVMDELCPYYLEGDLFSSSKPIIMNNPWFTGKLKLHKVFNNDGYLVKKEELLYEYESMENSFFSEDPSYIPIIRGQMIGYYPAFPPPPCGNPFQLPNNSVLLSEILLQYQLVSINTKNRETTRKITDYFYSNSNGEIVTDSIQKFIKNIYDNNVHPLLPERLHHRVGNDSTFVRNKYPARFPQFYNEHEISIYPSYFSERTFGTYVGGVETTISGYNQVFNEQYNPIEIKRYDTNQNSFINWRTIEYNNDFKVSEIIDTDNPLESFLWGYNKTLPIAKVINANSNEVFHTSFEENGSTHSNAKTGRKVRQTNYNHTLTGLTPGKEYILSFWRLSWEAGPKRDLVAEVWQYNQYSVYPNSNGAYTISIPASLESPIDEVRFYPATAQMTTYTHDPLVGITSITDPNNRTVYYEYDGLGRLVKVTDDDGNILEHHEYHYRTGN